MNILGIKASNFLSHNKTTVEFTDGLIGILGATGSGKSSIIKDAVTWCIWGKARGSGAGDDLITTGEDECEVAVKLELNSATYTIIRERTRGKKTNLTLLHEGIDKSGMVLKDTQDKINKTIGMTYEIFVNSCCIEQGASDSFSKLTPSDASKVILKILQLDKFDAYKRLATERGFEYRIEFDTLQAKRSRLQEQIDTYTNQEALRADKQHKIDLLVAENIRLVSEYTKASIQHANVQAKLDRIYEQHTTLVAEEELVKKSIAKISKQSEFLSKMNGHCPLCTSSLTPESKALVKEKAEKEFIDLQTQLQDLQARLLDLTARKLDTQKNLNSFKLTEKALAVSNVESKIVAANAELGMLNSCEIDTDITNQLADTDTRITEVSLLLDVYSDLAGAFSSKGIPLLVIDNVLKELELLINQNLQLLSDMPISITIKTQRQATSGELVDTLEIVIDEGFESKSYFNYSGGEKLIIDMAIRIGLSELLARRNNFKVETMIIDEGLGSLDESNQISFFNALASLTKKFKKVFVVTHTQIKDYFDNAIFVEKINGSSCLQRSPNVL